MYAEISLNGFPHRRSRKIIYSNLLWQSKLIFCARYFRQCPGSKLHPVFVLMRINFRFPGPPIGLFCVWNRREVESCCCACVATSQSHRRPVNRCIYCCSSFIVYQPRVGPWAAAEGKAELVGSREQIDGPLDTLKRYFNPKLFTTYNIFDTVIPNQTQNNKKDYFIKYKTFLLLLNILCDYHYKIYYFVITIKYILFYYHY